MLDLESMADEEFSVLVTPSISQVTMHVTVEESGKIILSSKVAEKLSKIPVRVQFNQDCTAIQISQTTVEAGENSIIFPKNGRKAGLNAAKILKERHIPLPAVFSGHFCKESNKWRGERQVNPISKRSTISRNTKKKSTNCPHDIAK